MKFFSLSSEKRKDKTIIKRFKLFSITLFRISKNINSSIIRILGIPFISSKRDFNIHYTTKFLGFPLYKKNCSIRNSLEVCYLLGFKVKEKEFLSEQIEIHQKLMNDRRFRIDFEYYQKYLQYEEIASYDVVKIKLGDIRRIVDNKLYPLDAPEILPTQYLRGGVTDIYIKYLSNLKSKCNHSLERFENLIQSMSKTIDDKFMPIINENNVLKDGQHRCCFLIAKYGSEHTISALRIIQK